MFGIDDAVGIAGIGLQVAGGLQASAAAKKKADAEKQIAGLEMQVNEQRRHAMELANSRDQKETVRKAQVARSMGLAAGANQGAQFSSGVQGGMQSTTSNAAWSLLGMSQNLQIGENVFELDREIDAQKMAVADAESKEASAMGLSAIGKGVSSLGGLGFMKGGSS